MALTQCVNIQIPYQSIERIYSEKPMFKELVIGGKVHPLQIEWVNEDQLITNPKTGKLCMVVDRRFEG